MFIFIEISDKILNHFKRESIKNSLFVIFPFYLICYIKIYFYSYLYIFFILNYRKTFQLYHIIFFPYKYLFFFSQHSVFPLILFNSY